MMTTPELITIAGVAALGAVVIRLLARRWLRVEVRNDSVYMVVSRPAEVVEEDEDEETDMADEPQGEPKFATGDLVEHRASNERGVVIGSYWEGNDEGWVYELDVGFEASRVEGQSEVLLVLATDQRHGS